VERTQMRSVAAIMQSLELLCALNLHVTRAGATTVVIIRTPQEVVIATDSASTIRGDGLPVTSRTVCKIYQADTRLFFAVSGLVNDFVSGFNIPKLIASVIREGGSMTARLSRVERQVEAAVLSELPRLKERDPDGYAKVINSAGAVTVGLVGTDGGVPAAAIFSVGLVVSPDGAIRTKILRDTCPGNCPSGVRAFWFGEGGAIERLRASGRLPQLEMPELARYLVQVEIDSGAPSVGGPVDVLRILPAGPIWIREKPSCPVTLTDTTK
jgi:hypothetical protein